ncbi:Fic family protein [Kitasatospora sp. McL0602]|uniref:Fic family protein n=1 Tax=Kitasatospora sp. McL0602 TaxID=3439530 RepID=UPI003F8B6B77
MPDHLQTWCTVRQAVPWQQARTPDLPGSGPPHVLRDGADHHIRTVEHARDPARAQRLLAALGQVRVDAAAGQPLSFALLSGWQRLVLGTPDAPFRAGPAFAKAGRERYGLDAHTPRRFDACLAQSEDPGLPLPARAARAYLDVCFFHPFEDGNARSAFLALVFVLARSGVVFDQVGPIRCVQRPADDPDGALALADLVTALINASHRRRVHGQGVRAVTRDEHAQVTTSWASGAPSSV